MVVGGIKVLYSRLGDTADLVIKKTVDSGSEWIVITSDREVADYAWSRGAVPVPSADFLDLLERAGVDNDGPYEFIEEDDAPLDRKKGRSRMLSRREKAVIRVKKKL